MPPALVCPSDVPVGWRNSSPRRPEATTLTSATTMTRLLEEMALTLIIGRRRRRNIRTGCGAALMIGRAPVPDPPGAKSTSTTRRFNRRADSASENSEHGRELLPRHQSAGGPSLPKRVSGFSVVDTGRAVTDISRRHAMSRQC